MKGKRMIMETIQPLEGQIDPGSGMSAIFPPKYRVKPALFLAYSGICVFSAARFSSVAQAIWRR